MKILTGTSGFSYDEWKGEFYPARITGKEMLRYYSARFRTVEVNNTFYRMPTERLLTSWAEEVPDGFIFAMKAPRVITHVKGLKDVEEEMDHLFRMLSVLGARLGPVLFQFPATFHVDPAVLEDHVDLIPPGHSCAFEFRSPSGLHPRIPDILAGSGCTLCISDSDENPVEMIPQVPWGYLRLRRGAYSEAGLSRWLEKIGSQDWNRAFVYFKHGEGAGSPGAAMRFDELVRNDRRPAVAGGTPGDGT